MKWEYRSEHCELTAECYEPHLQEMGAAGWELCSCSFLDDGQFLIWRRPIDGYPEVQIGDMSASTLEKLLSGWRVEGTLEGWKARSPDGGVGIEAGTFVELLAGIREIESDALR